MKEDIVNYSPTVMFRGTHVHIFYIYKNTFNEFLNPQKTYLYNYFSYESDSETLQYFSSDETL